MTWRSLFAGALALLLVLAPADARRKPKPASKVKVACVGNSITYGMRLEDRERESYPAQLQALLGDRYEVGNFGKSGATLLRHGHRPYFEQEEFRQAMDFAGDIVVIHLESTIRTHGTGRITGTSSWGITLRSSTVSGASILRRGSSSRG